MNRRVVVTGLGVITPIGNSLQEFTASLREGRCGEGPITRFDTTGFPVKRAFEVKHFNPRQSHTTLLDPFIQYAVAASEEAIASSGVAFPTLDPARIGISMGSGKGGVHTLDRFKERFFNHPSALLGARIYANTVPNFAAQWIARRWRIQGPALCYVAACATGTVAVCEGARMVADGTVDYCLAGASDASIVPLMLAGYRQMKVLSPDGMFPFDQRRKGFLVGEGAGVVFLESWESARRRGAEIWGEVLGYHYGNDGSQTIQLDRRNAALSRVLDQTLAKVRWRPEEIGYINLHGTGTPGGDIYETEQIKMALNATAYQIPMSSTKSMTGHMLGAAGAAEIVATLVAMRHGFLPPTIRLEKPDKECDLDYVANCSRPHKITKALSISMGFGGHVAVIALGTV